MKEERVMESVEQEISAGMEKIGLSELGAVTKRTQGSWLGIFIDGGVPPFCRELLPFSGPQD